MNQRQSATWNYEDYRVTYHDNADFILVRKVLDVLLVFRVLF